MPAAARRAASSVHEAGTYKSHVKGHVRPSAINALDTATWQLPIFPSAPQYCRCTPTECVPCFGKPVSSSARIPQTDGHRGAQRRPDVGRLPRRMRDEVLQRLILARLAQPTMHGLHGLPLTVVEQAIEILTGRVPLRLAAEAGAEPIQRLAQASHQCPRAGRCHPRSVQNSADKYKRDRSAGPDQAAINLTK